MNVAIRSTSMLSPLMRRRGVRGSAFRSFVHRAV
jgi:hypothetical protein